MKTCCRCHLSASVRLVDIDSNGCMREVFLCPKHADYFDVLSAQSYNLLNDLPHQRIGTLLSRNICPHCGFIKEWLADKKRLGCPECYKTFKDVKLLGFKNCSIHFGKVPRGLQEKAYEPRIKYLNNKLQAFIRNENFEAAQQCRKQIKKFSRKLKNASTNL